MGDRGNILIHGVYLYTHWKGSQLYVILHNAMKRRQRWDDPAYLARIIFSEMIKGELKGEDGYGISTSLGDNEHPIFEVNCDCQKIIERDVESSDGSLRDLEWTFEEFVGCKPANVVKK